MLGLAMWFGRFGVIVPVLAMAGSLAAKKRLAPGAGTLPTHGPLFVALLIGVVLLVGLQAAEESVGSLQRMLERVSRPVAIDGEELSLSASIGVALIPEHGQTIDEALGNADLALTLIDPSKPAYALVREVTSAARRAATRWSARPS